MQALPNCRVCVYLLLSCPVDLWHFNLDLSVECGASGKVCVEVVVVGQATLRVGESGDTCTYESNDFVRMATCFSPARPLDDTLPSAPLLDGVGVPTQPLHTHRNARTHTRKMAEFRIASQAPTHTPAACPTRP
jgi:hypothetical protein